MAKPNQPRLTTAQKRVLREAVYENGICDIRYRLHLGTKFCMQRDGLIELVDGWGYWQLTPAGITAKKELEANDEKLDR